MQSPISNQILLSYTAALQKTTVSLFSSNLFSVDSVEFDSCVNVVKFLNYEKLSKEVQ